VRSKQLLSEEELNMSSKTKASHSSLHARQKPMPIRHTQEGMH